jgi:hypothetical protein
MNIRAPRNSQNLSSRVVERLNNPAAGLMCAATIRLRSI